MRGVLAQLPDDQLKVVELAYFGGLTQSEIAEALGMPLGTVKGRMRLGDGEDAGEARGGRVNDRDDHLPYEDDLAAYLLDALPPTRRGASSATSTAAPAARSASAGCEVGRDPAVVGRAGSSRRPSCASG